MDGIRVAIYAMSSFPCLPAFLFPCFLDFLLLRFLASSRPNLSYEQATTLARIDAVENVRAKMTADAYTATGLCSKGVGSCID